MTYLAIFRVGDVRLFLVKIELYDIGWAGLNTGLTAYASSDFTNGHVKFLVSLSKTKAVHNEHVL